MSIERLKQWSRALERWVRAHRGAAIAGTVVVFVATVSAVWLDKEAWGALGQWAGALGAVLAVAVALRIAQREADNEAARRRAERVEHELQQARLVVVTIQYPGYQEEILAKNVGQEPQEIVTITNYSGTHVFHPRIEGFVHQNGGTITWDVGTEDPDDYGAPTVLGSGGVDRIPVSLKYDPPITEAMYPMRTKVVIGFTDADGRRWRRLGEDTPERVQAGDTFEIGGPDWYRVER